MNKTIKELMRKTCAMLIIFALMSSDFMFVGQSIVSYALDKIETNNTNVDFMAYFLDEDGNKVSKIEKDITENGANLYVDISVKKEGYFNGDIYLQNSNFKIKENLNNVSQKADSTIAPTTSEKDNIMDEKSTKINDTANIDTSSKERNDIREISDNKVVLNQINAGGTVTIKLDIEPITADLIAKTTLDTETDVILEGQYVNSKNVENNKSIQVNGTSKVEVNWKSSNEIKSELLANVLTNSIYQVDGEEKRVVQFLVSSRIINNQYPVKNTEISISVPNKTDNVTVYARNTSATNSNIEFSSKNYEYDLKTNTIKIKLDNEDEKNISWKKDAKDIFVITYYINKDDDISNSYATVNSRILTYDNKELKETSNVYINEDIKEIVSLSQTSTEEAIYKGKIYTKEEKEYTIINQINVNYDLDVNFMTIKENEAKFISDENEINAPITYKSTKINKKEFIALFGEDGYITVKDSNQNIISNINKETIENENGDIIINYPANIKSVEFSTSKPITVGTLNLNNTKLIKNTDLSREEIKKFTGIEESSNIYYNENSYSVENKHIINLKDTTSKASLNISTDKLSSTEINEKVRITAVLENNDESKDLYKNPIIKITMPEKVIGMTAKCKLLYGNGLTLNRAEIIKEDNKNVLQIILEGEQLNYNTEAVEGTTIIVYADLEVDRFSINSDEEIRLNYTNEIATNFEDNGEQKQKVKIISTEGLIITNNIEAFGIKTTGNIGAKDINVPVSAERKNAIVDIDIINNEGAMISDIKIVGTFPTKKDDNLGVTLDSGLKLLSQNDSVQIFYSEKENPSDDILDESNGWTKQGNSQTTKAYLIKIDTMQIGEHIKVQYNINIPENLNYNQKATEGYKVKYKNTANNVEKTLESAIINITTGMGPNIDFKVKSTVGNDVVGEDEEKQARNSVTSGEIIRYDVTLKNTGSEPANNLQIEQIIPENTTLIMYQKADANNSEINNLLDVNRFIEKENKTQTITIEKLDIGEEKTISLYLKANKAENINEIKNQINIKYKEKTETKYITNSLNNSNIYNVNLIANDEESDKESIEEGKQYKYELILKKSNNTNLENINIQFFNNDLFEIDKIEYFDFSEIEKEEYEGRTLERTNKLSVKNPRNIYVYVTAKKPIENTKNAELYAIITENKNKLRTNKISKEVKAQEEIKDAIIELSANNLGENVNLGQEINYTIKIENPVEGRDIGELNISDYISNELKIEGLELNGNIVPESHYYISRDKETDAKVLNYNLSLNKGEKANIVIKTRVNEDIQSYTERELTNNVKTKIGNDLELSTDKVIHLLGATAQDARDESYIEDNEEENENEETASENVEDKIKTEGSKEITNKENENTEQKINSSDITNNILNIQNKEKPEAIENKKDEKTYTISGTAWLDLNEDGRKDASEQRIKDVKAILIDTKTNAIALDANNKEITTKTDDEGFYAFNKVSQGRYIVAFEYDTEKYVLTLYQTEGVSSQHNSDVENANITLNDQNSKLALTDNIEIINSSKTNTDIGLVEAKIFDLKLSKSVSKLTVLNQEGNKTKEYNGETLAKTEIDAKYLSGSTVVIEYKITVKNEGEVAGYAKNIIDYKPHDLSFNSSLNPEWYQSGDYIYSSSLANTKLEPGETKELKLVLTKTMTETNTGLVNNTAEIESDYNKLGILDTDSTAGNKKAEEDDMSAANVIISVKTGAAINYIAITLSIIIIISAGIFVIGKKVLKENTDF